MSERADNRLAGSGPAVQAAAPAGEADLLRQLAGRLDPVALGTAFAVVCGSLLFLATNLLVLKGGDDVGPHLVLLAQYFPGYRVTLAGSVIGALWAASGAFLFGWLAAHLRNALLNAYVGMVRLWANFFDTHFLDRVD